MKVRFAKSFSRLLKTQRKFQSLFEKAWKSSQTKTRPTSTRSKGGANPVLREIVGFGSNPGRLGMKLFLPKRLPAKPPLVVILHGCRQTPESFDASSGFSRLAAQRGFVLLYPQQKNANNAHGCFNWFRPSAVARDRGELMSVRQMIEHAIDRHRIDRTRVYIAGLSAGGAMTSAVIATYPGLFAGVAIVAGMPFGTARDAVSALRAMKSGTAPPPGGWGSPVKAVSPAQSVWPPVSIWQGTEDRVVKSVNAKACVAQWLEVGGIPEEMRRTVVRPWGTLVRWEQDGRFRVLLYMLQGFGHGLPVRDLGKKGRGRKLDPYVLDAGISAPAELMRLWGLKRFVP